MFHSFFYDIRQDSSTTTAHSKRLIELLKEQKVLASSLSTLLGNTYGCVEQYICASALYLMSVMSQCYSVMIDRGISAPENVKEVVDGLNTHYKRYIFQLMSNIQLTGSKTFDSQILMHSFTHKN